MIIHVAIIAVHSIIMDSLYMIIVIFKVQIAF